MVKSETKRLPRRLSAFLMAMVMTLSLLLGVSSTAQAEEDTPRTNGWNYEVSGATITAGYYEHGADLLPKKSATLTISAPTATTYTGSAIEATVGSWQKTSGDDINGIAAVPTDITYTSTTDGVALVNGKPVNAGSYTANVTLTVSGHNYVAGKDFTIDKAEQNSFVVVAPSEITYDGDGHILARASGGIGTISYSVKQDDGEWQDYAYAPEVSDPGVYTVKVTAAGDSNHNPKTITKTVEIKDTRTKIKNVSLEVKVPVGQTFVKADAETDPSRPEVTVSGADNYRVSWSMYVKGFPSEIADYDIYNDLAGTKTEEGKYYYAEIYLMPANDTIFDPATIKNNIKLAGVESYELGMCNETQIGLFVKVKAGAKTTEATTEVTTAATTQAPVIEQPTHTEIPKWVSYKGAIVAVDKKGNVVKQTGVVTYQGNKVLVAGGVLYTKPVIYQDKADGKWKFFNKGIQVTSGDGFVYQYGKLWRITKGELNTAPGFVKYNGKYVFSYKGSAATNYTGWITFQGYRCYLKNGTLVTFTRAATKK